MIRTAIAALLLSSSVGFAASLEDCGPEASIGIENEFETEITDEWEDTTTFKLELTWVIGKRRKCEEYNEEVINEQRADALEARTEALVEKIEVCSSFTPETAPRSIRKFCGDLLIGE